MNSVKILIDALEVDKFGGKAANLARMLKAGLSVPDGFVVSTESFNEVGTLSLEAIGAINKLIDDTKSYAIRSSALAEDAENASWAGQFETFLNIKKNDIFSKIEECHNSTKNRAKAYAGDDSLESFEISVVIQEMISPIYAGVLFTKDPLSGEDRLVTEYVDGLAEGLVSGQVDPKSISWTPGEKIESPINITELTILAKKVEELFGVPQDIEWAMDDRGVWLVQARPITTKSKLTGKYYLGEPDNLFYWGPSRAKPLYMSDFIAATEKFFLYLTSNESQPNPPKTLVLFCDDKMVWLNNASDFNNFTIKLFEEYEKQNRLSEDVKNWQNNSTKLTMLIGNEFSSVLIGAWTNTIFAEFALYGAESVLISRLKRFDSNSRQKIWVAFTSPDNSTFLSRIDQELQETNDPHELAIKYPWISDGYDGIQNKAEQYFTDRIKILEDVSPEKNETSNRTKLAEEFNLSKDEITALNLARKLAEFMDDRKQWMMQSRRLIKNSLCEYENGWFFDDGLSKRVSKNDSIELWNRYINFKASTEVLSGIVASNANKHFINGEVYIVNSPTDNVPHGKILVVPSTSPSYVPLMRNAKALITDHGGMMSHAAIVAREFGLACIVGTKQATKVLNNGDKVVLDLLKGEVNR